ncbi:hypothetical protein H1R20_g6647, partial [Candolleomyces eurysporus]
MARASGTPNTSSVTSSTKTTKRVNATKLKIVIKPLVPSTKAGTPNSGESVDNDNVSTSDADGTCDVGSAALADDVDSPSSSGPSDNANIKNWEVQAATSGRSESPASLEDASQANNNFEDNYDCEDNLDYQQKEEDEGEEQGESNSDASCQLEKGHKPSKSKTKGEKGFHHRTEVNTRHQTSSTLAISKAVQSALLKRKQRADNDIDLGTSTKHKAPTKRHEHKEPSGLLKGFRSTLQTKKASSSSHRTQSTASNGNDIDEYNSGVFDQDEDKISLKRAHNSKAKGSMRGNKVDSSVCIIEPTPPTLPIVITRHQFKKEQCKKSNLPFPVTHANHCCKLWYQQFKPTLIAWNVMLCQPFSSRTLLSTQVQSVWAKVFRKLAPLNEDDDRWHIVETVAGVMEYLRLLSGLTIEVEIEGGKGNEAGVEAAKYLLKDHRFVYGDPDAEEAKSAQPIQSPFILQTFSSHLRQVIHTVKDKISGDAIGALGLCATTVERALTLICDGHISIKEWPPVLLPPVQAVNTTDFAACTGTQARRGPGSGRRHKANFTHFSESVWGYQTWSFAETAANLPNEHWDSIMEAAITNNIQQMIDALQVGNDDEDTPPFNMRANQDSCANLCM